MSSKPSTPNQSEHRNTGDKKRTLAGAVPSHGNRESGRYVTVEDSGARSVDLTGVLTSKRGREQLHAMRIVQKHASKGRK